MKKITFIAIGFINNHFFGWDNCNYDTEEEIIEYLKNLKKSPLNSYCRFIENNFSNDYRNVSGQFQTEPLAFVLGRRTVKNSLYNKTYAKYELETILYLPNFKDFLSEECLTDIDNTIKEWVEKSVYWGKEKY